MRVDRFLALSVLCAPVPSWLRYAPDQEQHFSTPVSHEQRFADELMGGSPCVNLGRREFQVLLNDFIRAFDSTGSTYVQGGLFDVGVRVDSGRVFLTDLTFSWEMNQRDEYAALFTTVAGAECLRRGIQYVAVSGPSLSVMSRVCGGAGGIFNDVNVGVFLYIEAKELVNNVSSMVDSVFSRRGTSVVLNAGCECFASTALNVRDIDDTYLDDFAHMLYRLHCRIAEGCVSELRSQTAYVVTSARGDPCVGTLWLMEIRPCAQRLGLGRLLLWRMIRSFYMYGCEKFVVSSAVSATQKLCKSMGFEIEMEDEEDTDCFMLSSEMEQRIEPSACGIHSISQASGEIFKLDAARFPQAVELNNQVSLDTRGGQAMDEGRV